MKQRPRDPRAPLLDTASVRFVFIAGAFSALIGGLLLILLPRYGYSNEVSRSLLFLYATVSQLVLAYPARRILTVPRMNIALHLTIALCFAVQVLTVFVPGLRLLLGLELPDTLGLAWVAAAVVLSWGFAETYSRLAITKPRQTESERVGWTNNSSRLKRVFVAVVGSTVLLIGIAMLVLPGPAFIVIPLGLAILATEFVWARVLLKKARDMFPKPNKSKGNSLRPKAT